MKDNFLRAASIAARHPAFLFSAGNTALAIGEAEPIAIAINMVLCATIFSARFIEVLRKRQLGVPFSILAIVNFFTALSIEFNRAIGQHGSSLFAEGLKRANYQMLSNAFVQFNLHNLFTVNHVIIAAHVSALAYIAWGIGHIFAGRHEKLNTTARNPGENPQTYYGVGDMSAVNASGSVNPFSFPFMIIGFIRSIFIGRKRNVPRANRALRFLDEEATPARLYGIGYLVGALTSILVLNFFIAQLFWATAYFQFKKDN